MGTSKTLLTDNTPWHFTWPLPLPEKIDDARYLRRLQPPNPLARTPMFATNNQCSTISLWLTPGDFARQGRPPVAIVLKYFFSSFFWINAFYGWIFCFPGYFQYVSVDTSLVRTFTKLFFVTKCHKWVFAMLEAYRGTQSFIRNSENRKAPKTKHFFRGCRLHTEARVWRQTWPDAT